MWLPNAVVLLGCGGREPLPPFESTLADCGDSLEVWLGRQAPYESTPPLGAAYSDALADWAEVDPECGLGAFAGACADGKRLLYRNGGFTSEIRYFDGELLVGVVSSGDVGICPSVCPFSHYYGSPESVRCEAPALEELCPGSVLGASDTDLWMPFANGAPPGGCSD
jgi:hypothetical protein